ncbi:hypothetical protein CTZ27_35550 [Streptomyces griseocarneus]|nr:hypothetical protein CTZ27_35550 [Streptomyces griseocarneus]
MIVCPGTAMPSFVARRSGQESPPRAEAPAGARYRAAHGDVSAWTEDMLEVYYDLARALPFPDTGPTGVDR